MTEQNGKKIILLSDGTGNSAGSPHRTNVWRFYEALDVQRDDQVAFYDNGVGSQDSVVLKVLGGAFGYGLKSNVLELYKMLCRSYRPGDKIYLLGFSRGAFTVRVLAGMIAKCGLMIGNVDEARLDKVAEKNYGALRAEFKQTPLSRLVRRLRKISDTGESNVTPDIQFVGVWDTVDAYGLPIDELSVLWDKYVFPMRFPDRELSLKVQSACHAVSIDDERLTFHPLLWNEKEESGERIEQVWFTGVHSDVGGGYPQNSLAFVTLDWMISRLEALDENSLTFIKEKRQQIAYQADWNGVIHDSRAGLASYYRYKPRCIKELCESTETNVYIQKPKIHRSVFERIEQDVVFYAPTGLPPEYEVVATDGDAPEYETQSQKHIREQAMSPALDMIFLRRWLYGALVFVTLLFLGSRFFLDWETNGTCVSWGCVFDPMLVFAKDILPDLLGGWFDAWRQNPNWLLAVVVAYFIFTRTRNWAWRATRHHAVKAWAQLKAGVDEIDSSVKETMAKPLHRWIFGFRAKAHSVFRTRMKWLMATLVFIIFFYLLLAIFSRTILHVRDSLGGLCEGSGEAIVLSGSASYRFQASNSCAASKIQLQAGKRYSFTATSEQLSDGDIASSVDGYSKVALMPWVPLRRRFSEPWFKLMGRIAEEGNETFAIGSSLTNYTAAKDGELFLYVNDAAFGLFPSSWALPYHWSFGENKGSVTVVIRVLGEG